MNLPEIAVYNFSAKSDADVQTAIRAVNRQVLEDFAPVWGGAYVCSLKNSAFTGAPGEEIADEPIAADAAMYIVDEAHLAGAAGYHDRNGGEIPFGFVFLESNQWTVTLSHEVLELIIDPLANCFVPGPDPRGGNNTVLHSYEVCDAVERTTYLIDGVRVSNFVTPQYFADGDGAGTRNDFLGTNLESFGALPGCHLGFFDLATGSFVFHIEPGAMSDSLGSLSKHRADKIMSRALPLGDERIPSPVRSALEKAISDTKDKGTRKVLKEALRRDAYKDSIEDAFKKNK